MSDETELIGDDGTMPTSFMRSAQTHFTSESVTEGHPDKLCDQISDAVLDAIIREDPDARVACETATTTGLVLVFGEISTSTYVDIPTIARDVIRDIGYRRGAYGFDADTCGVVTSIKEQSADIAGGVDESHEIRIGRLDSVDDAFAWDEGEGDRTRDWWLDAHRGFFRRRLPHVTDFDALPTVFERFTVVWPPALAD